MWLYNLGMYAYTGAIKLVSPFNAKAALWVAGRRDVFERMRKAIKPGERLFWLHAASLGEFEQGRPVIEHVRRRYPEYKILLTFFSPSGYEVRKNYEGADYIFYLPADTPRNVRRFMEIVRPEIAMFVKYEFWHNYLTALRGSHCRTFIFSTIFRRDSIFFRWYGSRWREALTTFERLFVQNEESKRLLVSIGVDRVTIAGDTRFDRVAEIARNTPRVEIVERFAGEAKVFVCGSTWAPDEEIIMPLLKAYPEMKFIIAPHEMDQARIDRMVGGAPNGAVRFTRCDGATDFEGVQMMVIDTIGILSSVYKYASYAYIGGGFGVGIHNTLEAATFGLPIAFGPNYHKFKEARDMIGTGSAHSVHSHEELREWLDAFESHSVFYNATRKVAADYVERNIGATDIILDGVFGRK